MDEATIEDEPEDEQQTSSRPETKTGLLPWSYIFKIATQQWAIFLLISIAIAVYLYINARKRKTTKETSSKISRDHVQGENKGQRKSPNKRD